MIHLGFFVSLAGIWITVLISNNNMKRWQAGEDKKLLGTSFVVIGIVQTVLTYYVMWYLRQIGVWK